MTIITRSVHNNTLNPVTLFVPGYDDVKPPVVIPASTTVDLFTVLTGDQLEAVQSLLQQFITAGEFTVTATVDTATFNPVGSGGGPTSLTHLHTLAGNASNVATDNSVLQIDIAHASIGINTAPDTTGTYAIQQLSGASYFQNLWCNDFWVNDYLFAGLCYVGTLAGRTLNGPTYIQSNGDSLQGIILEDAELVPILTVDTVNKIVGIGEQPNTTAILDVQSTTKGFLPPRMSGAQRDAIASPAEGLHIYNLDTHTGNYWNGSSWISY